MSNHKRKNGIVSERTELALVTVWVLVILAPHNYVVFCVPESWFCRGVCPVFFLVVLEHPSDNILGLPFAQLLVRLVMLCTIRHARPQFGSITRNSWFHW